MVTGRACCRRTCCRYASCTRRPLSPGCYLPAAVFRLLSFCCCLQAAMLPGKYCLPALYQPVSRILFTTIPLVLGALVEMPE